MSNAPEDILVSSNRAHARASVSIPESIRCSAVLKSLHHNENGVKDYPRMINVKCDLNGLFLVNHLHGA